MKKDRSGNSEQNNHSKQPNKRGGEKLKTNVEKVVLNKDTKQPETLVKQAFLPVSNKDVKQTLNPVLKPSEKQIVTAPNEDISKWKNYANIYYKRSVKKPSPKLSEKQLKQTIKTRSENKEKYQDYKNLLEASGIKVIEDEGRLVFK